MKLIFNILLALVFSGCDGSSDKSTSSGVFVQGLSAEPSDLHPLRSQERVSNKITLQSLHYASNVVESLLIFDLDTYKLKPHLAKSWKTSEDKREFIFSLRKDVYFHDGTLMTADDVDFSFKAIFDDKFDAHSLQSVFKNFSSSKILDKHTIKFTAKSMYYKNLETLGKLSIISKDFYSKQSKINKLSKTVVGSGPYKFNKWSKGKSIVLSKFDKYWGRNTVSKKNMYNFDKIIFKFISDPSLRVLMLERGKLDYVDSVSPSSFTKKMTKAPWGDSVLAIKAENKLPKKLSFIGLNNSNKILRDKSVRSALAHMVNRVFINEKFFYGMNNLATGPFRIVSKFSNPQTKSVPFDLKTAKELLQSVGWSDTNGDGVLDKDIDGTRTPLVFNILNSSASATKILTYIAEDMKKIGVKMKISTVGWTAFTKAVGEGKFDAVLMNWGGQSINPDPTHIWHSKSIEGLGSNIVSYSNPAVDKLIEEAVNITNVKKRTVLFHKIHDLIAEDTPYIFLYEPKYNLYAVNKRVVRPKDTFTYSIGPRMWSLPN